MRVEALAQACRAAIARPGAKPRISVALPRCWRAPKGFPRRELLCVNGLGERVYSIPADRLLRWLVAEGLVAEAKPGENPTKRRRASGPQPASTGTGEAVPAGQATESDGKATE